MTATFGTTMTMTVQPARRARAVAPPPPHEPMAVNAARVFVPHRHDPIGAERLTRLRALVLLSGSVRPGGWVGVLGRSALDLPVERGRSLLTHWLRRAEALCEMAGAASSSRVVGDGIGVRVLLDHVSAAPRCSAVHAGARVRPLLERDSCGYRGTGGLLRDLAANYDDGDYLLVAAGTQVFHGSLPRLAALLASRSPDVALLAHDDGRPPALMWVRCGCLRLVPGVGFNDFKEQVLPRIAKSHQVSVVSHAPVSTPFRTAADYLGAVRAHHLRRTGDSRPGDPFAEDWRPAFSLVEDGAEVHETARVIDSVVLRGARVGAGAKVVRSLVGPGGAVRPGQRAVDAFVTGTSRWARDASVSPR